MESGSFPQAVPQDQVRRKKRARPWSPAFLSQTGGSLHTCSFSVHPGHHKNFYIMVENRLGSVSASGTKNVLLIHLNPHIFLNSYSSHENTVTGKSVTNLPDNKPCKVPREHSTEGHHCGHMHVLTAEQNWRCCQDHHMVITYVGLSVTSPLTDI